MTLAWTAVVLTLPFTFGMPAPQGLATMVSVLVGGLSGGLMAGILTGIPGTPSSVATTFDGFPMARKGEPGLALGIGVWSSFAGGMISAVLLVTLAPQLARIGLEFHPWDYFMLVMFALTITASLAGENMVKGLIAGALGLLIRTVGEDEAIGMARFNFGSDTLLQGFDFIAVLIGLFAFSQLLRDVRDPVAARKSLTDKGTIYVRIEHRRAIREVLKRWTIVVRSSLIGVFPGILPGAGGSIATLLAYHPAQQAPTPPANASKTSRGPSAGCMTALMQHLGFKLTGAGLLVPPGALIKEVVPPDPARPLGLKSGTFAPPKISKNCCFFAGFAIHAGRFWRMIRKPINFYAN